MLGFLYLDNIENGHVYTVILAQFDTFCCPISLFIVLHKANTYFLCADFRRLRYVYN